MYVQSIDLDLVGVDRMSNLSMYGYGPYIMYCAHYKVMQGQLLVQGLVRSTFYNVFKQTFIHALFLLSIWAYCGLNDTGVGSMYRWLHDLSNMRQNLIVPFRSLNVRVKRFIHIERIEKCGLYRSRRVNFFQSNFLLNLWDLFFKDYLVQNARELSKYFSLWL